MPVSLPPALEAALLAYITLFDTCGIVCRKAVRKAILAHGKPCSRTVYRGQGRTDKTIKHTTPFFSTTPKRAMADLFVERDWDKPPPEQRVGHLFKIHLVGVKTLNTRDVRFTLSDEVRLILKKINGRRLVRKGHRDRTFDEFWPSMRGLLDRLVVSNAGSNGAEILVPTGHRFFKDAAMTAGGFTETGRGIYETWYSATR
jgi:hypothetical protein